MVKTAVLNPTGAMYGESSIWISSLGLRQKGKELLKLFVPWLRLLIVEVVISISALVSAVL